MGQKLIFFFFFFFFFFFKKKKKKKGGGGGGGRMSRSPSGRRRPQIATDLVPVFDIARNSKPRWHRQRPIPSRKKRLPVLLRAS